MKKDLLALLPKPAKGEIRIAVLSGEDSFVAHLDRKEAEEKMDAFEKRASLKKDDRKNKETHGSIRIWAAEGLRKPNADKAFANLLASGILWLAMRHWKEGDLIIKNVDAMLKENKTPVITASIAIPAPEGVMPDTAWAFMVGEKVHDGREQLKGMAPDQVKVIGGKASNV